MISSSTKWTRVRDFLIHATFLVCVLLCVGYSSGRMGAQTDALGKGLGALFLTALMLLLATWEARSSGTDENWRGDLLTAFLLGALGSILLVVVPADGRPFAVGLTLAGFGLRTKGSQSSALALRAAMAVVLYAVLALLLRAGSAGYYLLEGWAYALDRVVYAITLSELTAGPTAAGCWVALLGLCLLLTSRGAAIRRQSIAMALSIVLIFASQVAFLVLAPALIETLNDTVGRGGHGGYKLNEIGWMLALLLGAFLALAYRKESTEVRLRSHFQSVLGACVVAGAAVALLAFFPSRATAQPLRVLLHDSGYLDNRIPTDKSYGSSGSGMFGHLSSALGGAECQVERRDLAQTPDLSEFDVLAVVNLVASFEPRDLERIHEFVEGGGGLVALGDHTGTVGIREPTNAITGRWGIELNFDSAVAFRSSWRDSMEVLPHAITRGIGRSEQVRIWTGASLSLNWPAAPLVVGRNAYADAGDLEATDRGHLGDMHYRVGERISDVVLAATAEPGAGRVVVFGDTSSFQNFSLADALPMVASTFRWAGEKQRSSISVGVSTCVTALTMLGLMWLAAGMHSASWILVLMLGAIGALRVGAVEASKPDWASCLKGDKLPIAALAQGTIPMGTNLVWSRSSFGGLIAHLFRGKFHPIAPDQPMQEWIDQVELVLMPTPLTSFDSDEIELLDVWVKGGGQVLLTLGAGQSQSAAALLELLEVEIDSLPLGSAEIELLGEVARLRCGNPLSKLPADAQVLASVGEYDCIVWLPHGAGGWLLVADPQFLWNDNLEEEKQYMPENCQALLRLLDFLRGQV